MHDEPLLTIRLLGSFQVAQGEQPVAGLNQARLQELLAYLVLRRGRPVARSSLAFLFWPDSTEKQALTNGRHLYHRLRQAIPDAGRFLVADDLAVQWRADPGCRVDMIAFEEALARANGAADPAERADQLQQATALYGGELLPGCYSDWLLVERERLAQEYARALRQLITLREASRQYAEAIAFTRALLRHDPLDEPAHTDLMRLCALNGDRATALHAYHTCVTILRRELDVAPGRAARELYERLLNQDGAPAALPGGSILPLVGRDGPWAALQQAWRRAATRPQLALISGEAGIGKSRLAEELVEWVGRQGIAALVARCYPSGGELAYAPIVTWLRSQPPPPADPWLRELARLMPELLTQHPHLPPPGPLTEKWQRLHLFEALAGTLLNRRAALLLFIDDLQWCDGDTLDWLAYLLTDSRVQAGRPQLLVVAALRSGEADDGANLDAWRAGLVFGGHVTEVPLGPLSEQSTVALAGQVAERPLDPQQAAALYRDTEGQPLFIIETVRAGLGQGDAAGGPGMAAAATLPGRVRQVLAARLGQLSPGARGVIEAAAVIGRGFTYDVLRQATGLTEDELVNHLDEAWRRRLIREQGETDYDFSHDKLRQVAYDGLSRARRRHLHSRVAAALEAGHVADLDRVAGAIGSHYEAAGRPEQAIAWLERAAAAARRVYAHYDALVLVERTLGLLASLPRDATSAAGAARLHETAGDSRRWLAQHEAGRGAYETALAHTPPMHRVGRARLHCKIGKTVEGGNGTFEESAAHYEQAAEVLGTPAEGDEPAVWEAWCQIQMEHLLLLYWWQRGGEMAARISAVESDVARHGTAEQRATLLSHLNRQTNIANRYGPSPVALDYARAAYEALPAEASLEQRTQYQFAYGFNLIWHDKLDEAEAELQPALAATELTGDVALQARCLAYLLLVARRRELGGEMVDLAQRCLAVARPARMYNYIGAAEAGLAWVAWRAGSTAEAGRLARAALASWQRFKQVYPLQWQALWPLLGLALERDEVGEAIDHAGALLRPEQQALPDALAGPLAAGVWRPGRVGRPRRRAHTWRKRWPRRGG